MEPSDQQLLIERISRTLFFCCSIAAIIWFLPDWVREYTSPVQQTQRKLKTDIDLTTILKEIPTPPIHEQSIDDVLFFHYRMEDPKPYVQTLREQLNELSIENYHIVIDGTDHEIYIYNHGILHTRLLFIQQRVSPIPPKEASPMIAIVVGGLGFANTKELVEHPVPLTLSFSPAAPFSTSLAEASAAHWHEIIVDTRKLHVQHPENTLPFASGVLSQKPSKELSSNLMSLYPGFEKTQNPLALLTKKHLDIPSLIIQGKQQSIQNGFSAILIEHDDPELSLALEWSKQAQKEGYLIVMASELRYRNTHQEQEKTAPEEHE